MSKLHHKLVCKLAIICRKSLLEPVFLFSFFILFFAQSDLDAQFDLDWSRNFGGSQTDIATAILPTSDGGSLVGGYSFSTDLDANNIDEGGDIWFSKISNDGTIQWEKKYGGSGFDKLSMIIRTADGGFVLMGQTNSSDLSASFGGTDLLLLKINTNGTIIWEKIIGGAGEDIANGLVVRSDGGFCIVGSTNSDFENNTKMPFSKGWILRLDNAANIIWNKSVGGSNTDILTKIVTAPDGMLLAIGNSQSASDDITTNNGLADGWLIKFDDAGNLLFSKNYGGSQNDRFSDILIAFDELLIIGETTSNDIDINDSFGGKDLWFVRTSDTGNLLASKNFGGCGNESGQAILQKKDSLFVLGNTNSIDGDFVASKGNSDMFIGLLNPNGELLESTVWGGNEYDEVFAAAVSNDDELFVAGFSSSNDGNLFANNGREDFWVLKTQNTDSDTTVNEPINEVSLGDDIAICAGSVVEIDASANCSDCTFLWDDGSEDAIRQFSPSTTTQYEVTITDEQNVDVIGNILVQVFPELNITLVENPITCNDLSDGSLSVDISGGNEQYSIVWSTGQTNMSINNLSGNIYEVTVSDGIGCTASASTVLVNPSPLELSFSTNTVGCHSDSTGIIDLELSGGTSPYTFNWSNGATSEDLLAIEAGIYSVTILDDTGCEIMESFTIGESVPLGVLTDSVDPSNGSNGSIQVLPYGGQSPYFIEWSTGENGSSIYNLSDGVYSFTLTDNLGCTYTENIAIGTAVSTDEIGFSNINIYPNPTQGMVYLENVEPDSKIQIIDALGRKQYEGTSNKNKEILNLSSFQKGIYFIIIEKGKKKTVEKLIFQ